MKKKIKLNRLPENQRKFIDADFIKDLDETNKTYYLNFLNEYYGGGLYDNETIHGQAGLDMVNMKKEVNKRLNSGRFDAMSGVLNTSELSEDYVLEKQTDTYINLTNCIDENTVLLLDELKQANSYSEELEIVQKRIKEILIFFTKEYKNYRQKKNQTAKKLKKLNNTTEKK